MCEKRRYSIRVELTHPTRIATYEIKEVPNGTDQKLFIQNPKWEPFTLQLTEKRLPNVPGLLCGQLTFLSQKLTKIELQHLLHVWLLAMFFPERFKTRPILAAIGPKGSGKTTLIDQIGKILFGSAFKVAQLTDDPKDLDAALTSEFFVAIDNADRNINWLPDKLAVIATGGTIKRRTYYTTNKLVEFPLKAWVGITSRTPHFKREDVADRLLPFHIQRIPEFAAFHDIEQEVLQKRNLLLTALVRNVQIVLRHLSVKDTKRFQTTFRMADYAYFVHLISYAMGFHGDVANLLKRLAEEQLAFSIDGDHFFAAIAEWVTHYSGCEVTTGELFKQLSQMTPAEMTDFRSAQAFWHKLEDSRVTLQKLYSMKTRSGHAGIKYVTFWHPDKKPRRGDDDDSPVSSAA